MNLDKLTTESRHPETMNLDGMSLAEMLAKMNQEDRKVPVAVELALADIEAVVKAAIASFKQGGRLIYMGAGTSGRLGCCRMRADLWCVTRNGRWSNCRR